MSRQCCVYIITNYTNTVLYTGVTTNLQRRLNEHKSNKFPGFSSKYHLYKLVYFEIGDDMYGAISREKQIKAGSRAKKIALINSINPLWEDLSKDCLF